MARYGTARRTRGSITPARNGAAERARATRGFRRRPDEALAMTARAQTRHDGQEKIDGLRRPELLGEHRRRRTGRSRPARPRRRAVAEAPSRASARLSRQRLASCARYTRYTATASTYQTPVILQQMESPPVTPAANSQLGRRSRGACIEEVRTDDREIERVPRRHRRRVHGRPPRHGEQRRERRHRGRGEPPRDQVDAGQVREEQQEHRHAEPEEVLLPSPTARRRS